MVSYAVVSAHALVPAPAASWVCVMWGRAGVVGGGVRFQGSAFFLGCPLQMSALRKPKSGPHVAFFPANMLQGYQISSPLMLQGDRVRECGCCTHPPRLMYTSTLDVYINLGGCVRQPPLQSKRAGLEAFQEPQESPPAPPSPGTKQRPDAP